MVRSRPNTQTQTALSPEADSISKADESAPDTQAERIQVFKDTLDESTKNTEWLTADDLENRLGWDRSIIDGFLKTPA